MSSSGLNLLPRFRPLLAGFAILLLCCTATSSNAGSSPETLAESRDERDLFESRIRPVLVERCYECHNSAGRAEGGLALDYRTGILDGGDSGPAVLANQPDESPLLKAIRHEDGLRMPKDGPKLSPTIASDFSRWISSGAFDPRDKPPKAEELDAVTSWQAVRERRKAWWSFQPIQATSPPAVSNSAWANHPVDQFIFARLAKEKLQPAPLANRDTLLRRLSFILTGLPPTVAERKAYAADNSPDAYERQVDRLLASPQFGQHWARYWMDLFRYAESHGSEGDPAIPNAWRYRDYLIRALNADVPYDRLVREHIAGDLLPEPRFNDSLEINESAIGTGHYRFVEQGYAPTDPLEELVRSTDNQIDVLTKTFLGLTVSCARCHNHKFDPISQEDFYSLYGVMASNRPAQITVDTPRRQEQLREELQGVKADIKRAVTQSWLASIDTLAVKLESLPAPSPESERENKDAAANWSPAQRQVNDSLKTQLLNPLYAWVRISQSADAALAFQALFDEWQDSKARLAERRASNYQIHWDLTGEDASQWYQHGAGMTGSLTAAGVFQISVQGDRIIEGIYPAGVYSHQLSTKLSGQISSPNFEVQANALWIRAAGSKARARYVMQHYPRVAGPIYGSAGLNSNQLTWHRWDMNYWAGDRAYVEIATAADLPVEATDAQRSWFGIAEIIAVNDGEPVPQDEPAEFVSPLFNAAGKLPPRSQSQLVDWYKRSLQSCIAAWRDNTLTDSQANYLSFFVRTGLLPNELPNLPKAKHLVEQYRQLESQLHVSTRAPGILEAETADHPILTRGDHKQPGKLAPRGFIDVLDPKPYLPTGSGRLELAESILASDNPLSNRVFVNRIWQQIFGRGIVATPDNFGRLGQPPTHPQLLDYLATRLRDDEFSIKQLIRLLVTSRTFQLDSTPSAGIIETDPNNQWLSHMRVRRLDAEPIRDAILQVSGKLDADMYGPPSDASQSRRSLYLPVRRNALQPFLATFDSPAPFTTKGRRDITNVPAQSLAMMNDPFVVSAAQAWADRVFGDSSLTDDSARVNQMFKESLGRDASPAELSATLAYVEQVESFEADSSPWQDVAHALFGFKEFIYLH